MEVFDHEVLIHLYKNLWYYRGVDKIRNILKFKLGKKLPELNFTVFLGFLVFLIVLAAVALNQTLLLSPEKITHDGSRTGNRVGYKSYCYPEQGFVIYENEKMPFVTDEGEEVLWTQGDIDCYQKQQEEKDLPTPTSTPYPKTNTQKVNNITHDGSRTGKIIKYKEYCKGGQEISVYESELITKKAADGNTYSMTKEDWACSERDSVKSNLNRSNTNSSSGLTADQVNQLIQTNLLKQTLDDINNDMKSQRYGNCLTDVRNNLNNCLENCRSEWSYNSDACEAAYGVNGGINPNLNIYELCLTEANSVSNSCQTNCYSKYQFSSCNY